VKKRRRGRAAGPSRAVRRAGALPPLPPRPLDRYELLRLFADDLLAEAYAQEKSAGHQESGGHAKRFETGLDGDAALLAVLHRLEDCVDSALIRYEAQAAGVLARRGYAVAGGLDYMRPEET
jgi:hypothetical protein